MKFHNKLVRDRILEIITEAGDTPVSRILTDSEYVQALLSKLQEEVDEYIQSGDHQELADILEVVYALAALEQITPDRLEEVRAQKALSNGAFNKKIYLISTS